MANMANEKTVSHRKVDTIKEPPINSNVSTYENILFLALDSFTLYTIVDIIRPKPAIKPIKQTK